MLLRCCRQNQCLRHGHVVPCPCILSVRSEVTDIRADFGVSSKTENLSFTTWQHQKLIKWTGWWRNIRIRRWIWQMPRWLLWLKAWGSGRFSQLTVISASIGFRMGQHWRWFRKLLSISCKRWRIETERFISLIQRERFDYTKWRENLFNELTGKEISKRAMELQNALKKI